METNTKTVLKAFNVMFSFTPPAYPVPGVITIPGVDKDDAVKKLIEMTKDMKDVKVYDVVDIEDVPALAKTIDMDKLFADEAEIMAEDKKTIN